MARNSSNLSVDIISVLSLIGLTAVSGLLVCHRSFLVGPL